VIAAQVKNLTLPKIKKLIDQSVLLEETGDSYLDLEYKWYTDLVGHTNPYYHLFYLIAKKFKPQFSVELGSYRALASAHLAVGNPGGEVVTIDIHKDNGQEVDKAKTIETANRYPNLEYINGWTWDDWVVEKIKSYGKTIDFLYIDAWHRQDYCTKEWDLYSPLLSETSLVVCDDVYNSAGLFEGMEEWFDSLPGKKFLTGTPHTGVPMGFIIL